MAMSKDPEKRARQLANLKTFRKGHAVPAGAGRPRNVVTQAVEHFKQLLGGDIPSEKQIVEMLSMMPFVTEDALKEYIQNKDLPMFQRIYAKQILDKNGWNVIMDVLNKVIAKKMDVTTNGKDLTHEPITIEIIDKASQVEKRTE